LRGWLKRVAAVLSLAMLAAAAPQPSDPVVTLHAGLARTFAAPGGPSEASIEALALRTFDMPAITLAVLGDSARTATSAQRARLTKVLLARLARQIALSGRQGAGDGFTVVGTKAAGGADVLVTTREARPAAAGVQPQAVALAWRVRREGSRYRIVDSIRDGVSTVGVEHDDFAAQLKGRDVEWVVAHMERLAAAPRPEL